MGVDVGRKKHVIIGARTGKDRYEIYKRIVLSSWDDIHRLAETDALTLALTDGVELTLALTLALTEGVELTEAEILALTESDALGEELIEALGVGLTLALGEPLATGTPVFNSNGSTCLENPSKTYPKSPEFSAIAHIPCPTSQGKGTMYV
ncbi:unnamed protein product [marine sediment metagenome]|uniref:Uncharacterized protein n=1 Tax=marine sediment metagenome TaxID=412755 RepID=X1A033_9ZZZZ